ncbi:hypothetical protein [Haloarcula argentinensis]|uniref:DUF1998 domain-containing protein n=1 Tax=Haloarcula argentinensis TaxID=43776 RepID=A0A830FXB3_HALAR|nr:hypothetical protein [Haloarcula argentinensis]GGM50601.1 hypothetical protein GCM10009006_34650 [Haloarcula argentinensis]
MTNHMQRGKKQVMYNFPPKATFSNPKHNLIEISDTMFGEKMDISSEQELIDYVHAKLNSWEGGVADNSVPSPTRDQWVIADPERVYAEIFPRVFECMDCGKIHDYSGNRITGLEDSGQNCQRNGCDGNLTQIHHVGVCPSCSDISSINVPSCDDHGWSYVKLDDRADRYQNFKWRCGACNGAVIKEGIHAFCDCGEYMDVTVHSASKAMNIHDLTRVDLGTNNVYQSDLRSDEEIDPLVIGAYLGEFEHPETTLREMVQKDGVSGIDYDDLDADDPEVIEGVKEALGQIGGGEDPELVRRSVKNKVGDVEPTENMRRYIQLHEIMEQESAREDASTREEQLMDQMGILDIGVTSEFPLLKGVYGYHRTFNEQEDDKLTPAVRTFPPIKVEDGDWRTPIYTTRSKTEAAIVQLDPCAVGHWLSEAGYNIADTQDMDLPEARATLYAAMEPVEPYSTDVETNEKYNEVTRAVHRLLHTMSHLLMQRASVHSGIEETSFAEYLFTDALATAIYSNNTQNYTAGGLFTLTDRNLDDWLLSTLNQGERCMYDSTCAEIRGGACHACLHISEIGCQHFNKNLSRIDLYGERIAKNAPTGFWKLTGGLGST